MKKPSGRRFRPTTGRVLPVADRPATPPRLVAALLYLQHAYDLSDEAVVARWVETLFDGKTAPDAVF